MRVLVHLAVDVDKAAWINTYGSGITSKEISDEVRRYITNQVVESPAAHEGCFEGVEQR